MYPTTMRLLGATLPSAPNTEEGTMVGKAMAPVAAAVVSEPSVAPRYTPCIQLKASKTSGTTRVLSNGQPLVVQSSKAICAPTGTPLIIAVTQTRVAAT